MTTYLFKNNAVSTLAASMNLVDTTLTVGTGHGARFPSPAAAQAFVITVQDGSDYEIMTCTSRTGDVLTVTRGVDNTTAQTWDVGASVDIRIPALVLESFGQVDNMIAKAGGTMTGPLLLDDSVSVTVPVLAFDGDTNSGIAHPGQDTVAVVTSGVERLRASNSGVDITGTLNAIGDVAVTGNVGIGGALETTGPATFDSTVEVTGVATFNNDVAIVGEVTVASAAAFGSNVAVAGDVAVSGGATITEDLAVAGGATVAGNAAVTGTLTAANGSTGTRVVNYSQFPATLSDTGQHTLPNGFIEKWGTGSTTSGAGTVAFGTAFPTAIRNVQMTISGGSTPANLNPLIIGAADANGFFVYGGIGESVTFHWRAVGH